MLIWRVLSDDGHPVGGSISFSVGRPTSQSIDVVTIDPIVEGLLWLGRIGLTIALFGGVGGAVFAALLDPDRRAPRWTRQVAAGSALALAILVPITLLGEGLDRLGASPRLDLLPIALTGDDRHAKAHQRPDVPHQMPVRPEDLDHLPGRPERHRHLPDARVERTGIGVDLRQQPDLVFEGRLSQRIFIRIEPRIGPPRRRRIGAAMARTHGPHRIRRPLQCPLGNLAGMRIARHLIPHRPETKALIGVVCRRLEPAIVEHQTFRLAIFQKQLAIIRPAQRVCGDLAGGLGIQSGSGEEVEGDVGHGTSNGG